MRTWYVETRPVKTMPRDSQTEPRLFRFGIYTPASAADFTVRPMIFNPASSATLKPGPNSSKSQPINPQFEPPQRPLIPCVLLALSFTPKELPTWHLLPLHRSGASRKYSFLFSG